MGIGRVREFVRQFDWLLFASMIGLMGMGSTVLYSIAVGREGGDLSLVKKQIFVAVVGVALFFIVSSIDYHTWQGLGPYLYVATILVLGLVLVNGQTVNATRGWLSLGGWRVQPVEFAKGVAVIVLAAYFARRARSLGHLTYVLQSVVLVGVMAGLVLLQPDFGSAAIFFALWLFLLLVIGVKRRYVVGLMIFVLVALLSGWLFFFKPYQKERIKTFFFPSDRTAAQSYNVRQAVIAVGAGGLTGRGLGQGSQSQLRFLPEAETDFIFAVLAEELGFVGVLLLLGLFAVLYQRLLALFRRCRDDFGSFILLATIILTLVEVFVNAGMTMGLFPVVGIPLPLVSAGGSSLLAHAILLGVVESIARQERRSGYRLARVYAG